MEPIWTFSKWSKDQLDRKSVEFSFAADVGRAGGIGEFRVLQNPQGLLSINILVDLPNEHGGRTVTRFQVPQAGVDAIEKNEDQTVAEFLLLGMNIPRTV